MQEERSVAFPYFHLLARAIVGEGVCDHCGVVFVDDFLLGVSSGEDDGFVHGDMGTEKGGCGYILVVDQGFVESVERIIRDDLAGRVVSFSVDGGFSGVRSWEMACDLSFGLGVHVWDRFGCSGLLSITLLPQVRPTFDVGGICGLRCPQVWLGRWCSSGVGVHICVGPSVGGQAIRVGVIVCGSLLLSPPLFLWAGAGVVRPSGQLCGGSHSPSGRQELLLQLCDLGAKRGDLFGEAVGGILKGSLVLGEELSDLSELVCTNCYRMLLLIISMSM